MPGRENAQGREHAIGHPAVTDSQTGLANRLHFELVYSYIFAAGNRGVTFTVMLISLGEGVGEPELRTSGEKIERTTRDSDLVAHLGGGRYVVLLLGTNLQGARVAADRVEVTLGDGGDGAVCIGLAAYSPEMRESSELLEAADKALLTAEAAGGGIEFG
ncbi:MAG: diguanylate cyclase [Gemmatimonadota bacterium]|jgi:diguanylate cyclase (GGDEF)-like protein